MPRLYNRRGLGLLIWADGTLQAFPTYAEAVQVFDALAMALEGSGAICANLV